MRVLATLGAVVVVGIVAVVGAVVILEQRRSAWEDDAVETARQRAGDMAAQLDAGGRPADLPPDAGDDNVVQVIESHARIVAASPEVEGERALAYPAPGEAVEVAVPPDDDLFVVVSATTERADPDLGRMTVIVGRSLDTVDEPVADVTNLLRVAVPLLVLVAGLTTWFVAGRASH